MQNHSRASALFIAFLIYIVLVGIFLTVWTSVELRQEQLASILMGVALFCLALIAVVVYQSLRIFESAHTLAQGLTKQLTVHSRELFSELYRNSPVPYLLIDEKGVVESANFSSARLFNIEVTELEGVDMSESLEADDENKVSLMFEYFKQGRFVNDVEASIKRTDGSVRYLMVSLFSFTDPNGSKKGLMTLVDITKQKQVDKAKTEFVSLASHQLRTPVAAMRWNLELLQTVSGESLTGTQEEYIGKLVNELERMNTLVEDFLNVSKLELGTLKITKKTFDLTQFFSLIIDEYRVYAEKRGVVIETNWGDAFGAYTTDSHLLNMAVSNILGNAIKYTPSGGVVRAVATLSSDGLMISVSDTGIGIPLEEQEMIFSKLFRASNAQNQGVEGTGLGLYIVKEAIRLIGGTIGFESTPGSGTTFTLTIPK